MNWDAVSAIIIFVLMVWFLSVGVKSCGSPGVGRPDCIGAGYNKICD